MCKRQVESVLSVLVHLRLQEEYFDISVKYTEFLTYNSD